MLRSAGFPEVEEIDVTAEFGATARGWYEWRDRYAADLIAAEGEESFQERRSDSSKQLKGIEDGLLRRSLFIAVR